MLNWDFVKADPITYRATHGAIRFEVTVERTIARLRSRLRVRRAISSKSKHFGITGKPCGGVKNIRGSTNPFLVFSVYDQPRIAIKSRRRVVHYAIGESRAAVWALGPLIKNTPFFSPLVSLSPP